MFNLMLNATLQNTQNWWWKEFHLNFVYFVETPPMHFGIQISTKWIIFALGYDPFMDNFIIWANHEKVFKTLLKFASLPKENSIGEGRNPTPPPPPPQWNTLSPMWKNSTFAEEEKTIKNPNPHN